MNKVKVGQLVKITDEEIIELNKKYGISNVGTVLGEERFKSIEALRVNLGQPNRNGEDFLLPEEYLEPASIEFDKLKDGMDIVLVMGEERVEAEVYKRDDKFLEYDGEELIYTTKDSTTLRYKNRTTHHTTFWDPFEEDDIERFGLQIAEDF